MATDPEWANLVEIHGGDEVLAGLYANPPIFFPEPPPATAPTIPGRAHDLIRLGVPQAELNAAGSRAVFKALVATAMMWQQANPPCERMEWYRRLTSPEGRLGQQAPSRPRP